MLPDGKCGLGFEIEEVMETLAGFSITVHSRVEYTVAMVADEQGLCEEIY